MTGVVIAIGALIVAGYCLVEVRDLREQLARVDETADQALGKAQALEDHLSGLEPASTGRHTDGQPAVYRRPPLPQIGARP